MPGAPALAAAGAVVGCLLLAGAALVLCRGAFTYSFDDPYITLTLARRMLEGTYGINPGESAAPSSSILYPFLLAPFAALNGELYAPLLLNTAAAGIVCAIFAVLVQDALPTASRGRAASLALALCMASGVIALPLVGLEHGLHAALTAAAFLGTVRALQSGRAPAWLVPVLVCLPLIRFEGAALEVLIVAALALRRLWTAAATATAVTAVALLAWWLFMHALGLPFLPSSVLVKLAQEHQPGSGLVPAIAMRLAPEPGYRFGPVVLFKAIAIAIYPALPALGVLKRRRPLEVETWVAILTFGALAAHMLLAGRLLRYDVYADTLAWAAIAWLWLPHLARPFRTWAAVLLAACAILAVDLGLVVWTLGGPAGSRAILEQQAQLRRLAVEFYRGPVAVNDLGLASYRNPYGVLDLWGLGSEEARLARAKGQPGWMEQIVAEHGVGLAAIYTGWFGQAPGSWTLVGTMTNRHGIGFDGNDSVDVYATSPGAVPRVRTALLHLRAAAGDATLVSLK